MDHQEDWRQPDSAALFTNDLTAVVLNEIMKAGSNEDFLCKLRPIKHCLDSELLEIRHMDHFTAKTHMQKLRLDLSSVPKECCTRCNTLEDLKKWRAAANAKDSKAMSNSCGKVNEATENMGQSAKSSDHWKAMANTLMQSLTRSNEKGDKLKLRFTAIESG